MPVKVLSIVLFRTPIPTSQGTDPWHDAFGPFCLPSFPLSAVESGTSSPLPPVALTASGLPLRKPRPSAISPMLTTHHLHLVTHSSSSPAPSTTTDDDDSNSASADSLDDSSAPSSPLTRPAASPVRRPRIDPIEFAITSIPVLASVSCNQSPLVGAFLNRQWAGVVCTSQRAVQAWSEMLISITHEAVADYERLEFERRPNELRLPRTTTEWDRVPFFAVGPATSAALKKIVIGPPVGSGVSPNAVASSTIPIKPRIVLGGKSTGTAEHLARFILNYYDCQAGDEEVEAKPESETSTTDSPRSPAYALSNPLLVLQGDKALPVLPQILSTARPHPIPFETMRVYETGVDPNFSPNVDSLRNMLARARGIALSRRNSGRSSRRPSGSWTGGVGPPGSGGSDASGADTNPTTRDGWAMGSATLSPEEISLLQARQQVRAIAAARRAARNAREWKLEAEQQQQQQAAAALAVTGEAEAGPDLDGAQRRGSSSTVASSVVDGGDGGTESRFKSSQPQQASLRYAPSVAAVRPDWLVFYSPSGVKYALETLRKNEWIPPDGLGKQRTSSSSSSSISHPPTSRNPHRLAINTSTTIETRPLATYPRIATLGPTTARWIIENLGHEGVVVNVVSAKPGPEELKEAICAFEAAAAASARAWTLEAHGLEGIVPGCAVLVGSGQGQEDG
ncbi:hypothetical protein V8E36_003780 [Tilletia maclaganii]